MRGAAGTIRAGGRFGPSRWDGLVRRGAWRATGSGRPVRDAPSGEALRRFRAGRQAWRTAADDARRPHQSARQAVVSPAAGNGSA
ncbi:hypothetical protein A8H31_11095 [Burkholderia thailandensis]|nr:hypothetical protein A8H31_11095 [Burkholderia thailandensis]NOK40446.1 hypothetical protein [Burkholderia thailandensis]NOK51867.1 hypothetical protein [Burkholderia thailandensis]PNE72569.1 hypothetical protein A8H38_11250 [Burkholderia thailandensis]PNE84556.1 hypothetical protein A8H34_10925 [Burkholderia thailandensis]